MAYDAIIIGGGHNGLVTAAYLAKAGKKVCVLERRHVLGGCSVTEELWPGFKVSTASYVISLFQPAIIRELKLKEYGLTILPRSPSSFTPLPDGRSLLMGPEPGLNQREIARFSTKDAEQFPKYEALLERVAKVLEPVLAQTAPDPLPLPAKLRQISMGKWVGDLMKLVRMYQAFGRLGTDLPAAIELLTGAARPILDRWFEGEALKATLATDAIIGAMVAPSSPGSAYVLLHHVMGEAGGARGVWGFVQGGMGGLADALEKSCRDLKVEIRREAAVDKILTNGRKAAGVRLADGEELTAKVVASSVDPHLTFERFLADADLPAEFKAAVARIDYSSASAKINLALSEPPKFRINDREHSGGGVPPWLHGTVHISPTVDDIERAYDEAKYGKPSTRPVLELTLPTSVDRTIAPEGKHIASIFVQYAPYKLAPGATWDELKEPFADRCIDLLAEYVPGIKQTILHRQVLTPLDLERTYGLTGGNIFQGAMSLGQLHALRPVAGWADHRTPIAGLYLCGAASHPGGGVMGICGKNAAGEILKDG